MHNEIPFESKEERKKRELLKPNTKTKEKPLAAIVIVLLTIAVVLMTFRLIQNQMQINKLQNATYNGQVLEEYNISEEIANKTYTDPDGKYQFEYPSSWKIIDTIPQKYFNQKTYTTSEELENWLKSKMIISDCNDAVIFENKVDPDQLIIFDTVIDPSNNNHCWSSGYLMSNDKWKISSGYKYPVGGNVEVVPDWKGDFLKLKTLYEDEDTRISIALINYETYKLKGEESFNLISDSFKYANEEGSFSSVIDQDQDINSGININNLKFEFNDEFYAKNNGNYMGAKTVEFEKIDKPGPAVQIFDITQIDNYDPNKTIPELLKLSDSLSKSNLRNVNIFENEHLFFEHVEELETELRGLCEYGGTSETHFTHLSKDVLILVNTPTETKLCGETITTRYKYDVAEMEELLKIIESISTD